MHQIKFKQKNSENALRNIRMIRYVHCYRVVTAIIWRAMLVETPCMGDNVGYVGVWEHFHRTENDQ